MPMRSRTLRRIPPASSSSCWFISTGPDCTTCTSCPCCMQPVGRLQPEQAAADDDGGALLGGVVEHRGGVVEGAEPEDAGGERLVVDPHAVHRREERAAAGGDDQLVVRLDRAVVAEDLLGEPVDPHDPHAGVQRDVVVGVPVERVEVDLARSSCSVVAGQHVAEHDPVVVAVRLVAEHRDPELRAAAALEDLLDGAGAGHAVADDDQVLPSPGSSRQTSTSPRSTTTVPVSPSRAATCSSSTVPSSRSSTTASCDVHGVAGADREVAHRRAVAHQDDGDQLVRAVAAAEVQRLGGDAHRHGVGQRVVHGERACPRPGPRTGRSPAGSGVCCASVSPRAGCGGIGFQVRMAAGAATPFCSIGESGLLDGDRAGLELRHPRRRVERVAGQGVDAGRAAPVERDEHGVAAGCRGRAGRRAPRSPRGVDRRTGSPSAMPSRAGQLRVQLDVRARDGRGERRAAPGLRARLVLRRGPGRWSAGTGAPRRAARRRAGAGPRRSWRARPGWRSGRGTCAGCRGGPRPGTARRSPRPRPGARR